jgi:PAS domain S-box-containing protein
MLLIAKDMMRTDIPVLSFDTKVNEAVEFFARTASSFALVTTGTRIHGVLTEANLLRIFLRDRNAKESAEIIHHRQLFDPAQLAIETETFEDLFKKVLTAVGNRVFVINRKDELVGFVQIKDLWREIAAFTKKTTADTQGTGEQDPLTRLEQQVRNLRNEVFYFSNFFEKSPFMMHSADPAGRIQMANEMLHQALGYEYGDLIGRSIFEIYPDANHDMAREGLKKIMSEGYHEPVKGQMITRRKKTLDVELSSRALIEPSTKAQLGTITVSRLLDMKAHLFMQQERES